MHINKQVALTMLCTVLIMLAGLGTISAQNDEKMQWFKEAKLGIFIHWGLYAVDGIDESWSFYNGYLSHQDYLQQLHGFTASQYQPRDWAKLIRQSGARYAVFTTKHHDGFTLWDSQHGNLSVSNSPAQRDLVGPLVAALRQNDLKVGLYYSLPDWSYPDYTDSIKNVRRYTIDQQPARWNQFLKLLNGQLDELASRYQPDLYWFDGDWEHSAEAWQSAAIRARLLAQNPDAIINSRLTGQGDYATPEQGMPIIPPHDKYWELCMTMNNSWGYQPNDQHYKTVDQTIGIFVDVISKGGNLLLDIGPKADGSIPLEQRAILEGLGRWTQKHQEAIWGTSAGIPPGHFHGPTTLSEDQQILYLFVRGNPGGEIPILGLKNNINRIYVVGQGTKLDHQVVGKVYWSAYPGIKYIKVPDSVLDENMTVIALLLDGKIDLYREDGAVIEQN